jgi:murein L,D-transpeptidase YafK
MRTGRIIVFFFLLLTGIGSHAQMSAAPDFNFYTKESRVFKNIRDSIIQDLKQHGFEWPVSYMYLRAFKMEKQLEVWVKNDEADPFRLYKTYAVCAGSGTFGPKRREGDKQIPEGFYYINEWKPNSNYHLALGLNYPNASDMLLSDREKPGGDIYIHGNCVTVGCLPLTDSLIEHLYFLTAAAKEQGQDFIPVHIYPYRFHKKSSQKQYMARVKNNPFWEAFHQPLKQAYDFFENTHQLPAVLIDENGSYDIAINPDLPLVERIPEEEETPPVPASIPFEVSVDKLPVYIQGNAAFQKWLFQLSKELSAKLPPETSVSMQVEFIVDSEGVTRQAKVVRSVVDVFNPIVIERFEKELKWNPAMKDGKAVATKLFQNLTLSGPEDLD